jgi:hypothetical protein
MKPELPKVEASPLNGEILDSLNKAYGEKEAPATEGAEEAGRPALRNPQELLKAGSVGVEAGLKSFEVGADDNAASDDTSQSDDDDDSADTAVKAVQNPRIELGSAAVAQTPAVADDKDEIEKEWVGKAKRIVEQTKSDPFLQERAVSRLQADYMKKRFNKEVKLPGEEA